jgi:hypothetical protein
LIVRMVPQDNPTMPRRVTTPSEAATKSGVTIVVL